ncbi:helix-turn-helix domain-containing protein [Streptomyces mirabilis]|uniref:helix-turn-helix domain-containing protein n=1 Tax=Streptomyces mirabilis TaxID=68239 RepID=UPI0036B10422
MIEEVAGPWAAQRESALHERRGHDRQRAAGAGPNYQLVFVDRVLITLVCLRLHLPHAALAELYGVTRPTVTRAIHEIRPLLARRGLAVPQRPVRGCIPWLASSPMPRSRKSTCASTEPKCKSYQLLECAEYCVCISSDLESPPAIDAMVTLSVSGRGR